MRWDETYPALEGKKQVKMQRLYLRRQWWNQGLGKVLLDYATDWARQQGFTDLWLVVWEKNDGAIRFYERNGYTCIGRYDFQFGPEVHHDYVMHCTL
jgi:GNAT superfamily N-acetyltransferase